MENSHTFTLHCQFLQNVQLYAKQRVSFRISQAENVQYSTNNKLHN